MGFPLYGGKPTPSEEPARVELPNPLILTTPCDRKAFPLCFLGLFDRYKALKKLYLQHCWCFRSTFSAHNANIASYTRIRCVTPREPKGGAGGHPLPPAKGQLFGLARI